jgi:hypothetical protein
VPSIFWSLIPIAVLAATIAFAIVRARRRTHSRRPAREASAYVVLEGNIWDACSVDDVREPWSRFTTEPVRGFCGVSAGRHRIKTTTPAGEATIDFVVYPGEVFAWHLDPDRARWAPHDLEPDTRALLEGVPASSSDVSAAGRAKLPGWLVHLRTTMHVVSSRGTALPAKAADDVVDRVKKRLAKLVGRAQAESIDAHAELLTLARALGESLVGRGLTRKDMRALVAPARDAATRLAANGDTERAMRIVALGLAVLPGDPELMVVAGCALAEKGDVDEAMRALNAALERDRCLEPDDVARAMRARMELRSRLGPRVRVS